MAEPPTSPSVDPNAGEGGVRFVGGPESACRFIAAVSWPFERQENRDEWAVTMLHRPALLATEIEHARARLESAIALVTAAAKDFR